MMLITDASVAAANGNDEFTNVCRSESLDSQTDSDIVQWPDHTCPNYEHNDMTCDTPSRENHVDTLQPINTHLHTDDCIDLHVII